jgi:hypothetical protein
LDTYAGQLSIEDLADAVTDPRNYQAKGLVGHDKQSAELAKQIQRSLVKAHVDEMGAEGGFIDTAIRQTHARLPGVLPAVMILVSAPVDFQAYPGHANVGRLKYPRGKTIPGDGQKRIAAVLQAHERQPLDPSFRLSFLLIAPHADPLSIAQEEQIFYDANMKGHWLDQGTAILRDHRNLHNELAKTIANTHVIKSNGGAATIGKSVGKKSKAIVVLATLAAFARACGAGDLGAADQTNDLGDKSILKEETYHDVSQAVLSYFDSFVTGMTPKKFADRTSVHLLAPGWATLGVLFNDLYHRLGMRDIELISKASEIGRLPWHRGSDMFDGIRGQTTSPKGTVGEGWLLNGGERVRKAIVQRVRERIGIADRILALEAPRTVPNETPSPMVMEQPRVEKEMAASV